MCFRFTNRKKSTCLNYCEFALEYDLVGAPFAWYLLGKPFITLLKLVRGELEMVATNKKEMCRLKDAELAYSL